MADLGINLKGQDNLSQTVKNATKAVDELKYHSTEVGKASKEFDKITNSGKSLKAQLNQLKALMSDMNMKGLSNTEEFTRIAQAAGEIKDAMADANDAVNRFSSDTMKLDAAIQAVQGFAAAASIATGAMALFGSENEQVEQAILKVQSALSILNGVQAIANALNKDSALMQQIKQIKLAATTAITTANTVATTANTVATGANTVATTANTVAQQAWNVAKAIGKALFGDFTGLVLVGVGALTAYAIATSDATEADEQRNDIIDDGKRKQQERQEAEEKTASSVAQSASTQIAAYLKLQAKWNECGNDVKKQQKFMSDYKVELSNTGFAINSLSDAENIFVKHTNAVLAAIRARAEAQANYELMVERLKKGLQMTNEKSVRSGAYFTNANENNLTKEEKEALDQRFGKNGWRNSVSRPGAGGGAFTEFQGVNQQGLNFVNERRRQQALERSKQWQTENTNMMWEDVNVYLKNMQRANAEADRILKEANITLSTNTPRISTSAPHTSSTSHSNTGSTNKTQKDIEAAQGSLTKLEEEYSNLQKRMKDGLIPNTDENQQKLKSLQEQIKQKKVELKIELVPSEGSLKTMQEELTQLQESLSNGWIDEENIETAKKRIEQLKANIEAEKIRLGFELSPEAKKALEDAEKIKKANEELANIKPYEKKQTSYEKAIADKEKANGFITTSDQRLADIQKEMDYNDDIISQLREMLALYTQLGNADGIKAASDKLGELNQRQTELTSETQNLRQNQIDWSQQEAALNSIAGTANSVGGAFSSLGNMFTAVGDKSTAAVMEMVAATLQGVSQIIPQIMQLIAAKQGEAMANGTVSASKLDFPANIVAIASIIATILSTFASIKAATKKYANGGIVGGGSPYGDHLLARVNSGEMILNGKQQRRLFDLLDGGGAVGGAPMGNVNFVLRGADLYGSFHNYTKIKSKVGKQIL